MSKAKIAEIFKSYQGEGLWQNKEQVFVRFFGCNLECCFCDTPLRDYRIMELSQVLAAINSLGDFDSVSLTGGEPLLQEDFLIQLCLELKKYGKITYLETNGTLPVQLEKVINFIDIISFDFKLPSSTKGKPFWEEHQAFIKVGGKVDIFGKAVIGPETVLRDLERVITIIKGLKPDLYLILQPENPFEEKLGEKLLDFKARCESEGIFTQIVSQLHKKIGIK